MLEDSLGYMGSCLKQNKTKRNEISLNQGQGTLYNKVNDIINKQDVKDIEIQGTCTKMKRI